MTEWSVLVDLAGVGAVGSNVIDGLHRVLAMHGAALAVGRDTMSIRLAVDDAPDAAAAIDAAVAAVRDAETGVGIPAGTIVHVEATEWSRFEAELEQPNFPELLGVTELSALLGVTRQRAHQLAARNDFPQPVERLASGPIWTRQSVQNFVATWDRKPGRPPTPTATVPTMSTASAQQAAGAFAALASTPIGAGLLVGTVAALVVAGWMDRRRVKNTTTLAIVDRPPLSEMPEGYGQVLSMVDRIGERGVVKIGDLAAAGGYDDADTFEAELDAAIAQRQHAR